MRYWTGFIKLCSILLVHIETRHSLRMVLDNKLYSTYKFDYEVMWMASGDAMEQVHPEIPILN